MKRNAIFFGTRKQNDVLGGKKNKNKIKSTI